MEQRKKASVKNKSPSKLVFDKIWRILLDNFAKTLDVIHYQILPLQSFKNEDTLSKRFTLARKLAPNFLI